jgi:hypothetical protein
MNRLGKFVLSGAAACWMLSSAAVAEVYSFPNLSLAGSNENPPVTSSGGGSIAATYNDQTNELSFTVDWTLDVGSTALTMAHFHGPAPVGMNAGVQIGFISSSMPDSGSFSDTLTLNETQEADLLAGQWYVNLHSDQFMGGELRAQMIPATGVTHQAEGLAMEGSQQNPPVTTAATGELNATYDDATNQLAFSVRWENLSGPVTLAHFHGPAPVGMNAAPQIDFSSVVDQTASGTLAGVATLDATQEADLLAGLWYFNIHTAMNPGGEIRGQAVFAGPTAVAQWLEYEN